MITILQKYPYDMTFKGTVEELFETLPSKRRLHLLNIESDMSMFLSHYGSFFKEQEKEALLFASKYHDLGYHDELHFTGNHGLDLSLYLTNHFNPTELELKLIQFHTMTDENIEDDRIKNTRDSLSDRDLFLIDVLTYFDLHTNLQGKSVSLTSRINSVNRRKKVSKAFLEYATKVNDDIFHFMMENGKKALVFDVDNTISFDNTFSNETIKALRKANELGYEIVFNTGKLPNSLFENEPTLGHEVHKICLNGNVISKDKKNLMVIGKIEQYKEILRSHLNKNNIEYIEYTQKGVHTNHRLSDTNKQKIIDVGDFYLDPNENELVKIICFVEPHEKQKQQVIKELVKGKNLSAIRTSKYFYEIVPKQTNKGTGMKTLLEQIGVFYRASIAFGDNYNDVPMFEYAGKSYIMNESTNYLRNKGYTVMDSKEEVNAVSEVLHNIL